MVFIWVSFILITCLTPLISFFGVVAGYRSTYSREWKNFSYYGILYFATSFFNWLNLLFNTCFPEYLLVTNTVWCFTVMLNPVFLFRMVECYTDVKETPTRRLLSYGIPCVALLGFIIIFLNQLAYQPEKGLTYLLDSSPVVIIISIIGSGYMLMNIYLLAQYKKRMNSKKSDTKNKEKLSGIFIGISSILLIMSPAWFIFIQINGIFLLMTGVLMLTFSMLQIFLATNIIITGKDAKKIVSLQYVSVLNEGLTTLSDIPISSDDFDGMEPSTVALPLNKKYFNGWMKTKKPYLNPTLKVDELALLYGVSVRDLSSFLNREYRMNFNRYINRCRLAELRQLKVKNKHTRLTELVPQAGFGSMISYSRAKASIEKKKVQL